MKADFADFFVYVMISAWAGLMFMAIQFGTEMMVDGILHFFSLSVGLGIASLFGFSIMAAFLGLCYIFARAAETHVSDEETRLHVSIKVLMKHVLPTGLYLALTPKGMDMGLVVVVIALLLRFFFDKIAERFLRKKSYAELKAAGKVI
jgi:hypothetical protein